MLSTLEKLTFALSTKFVCHTKGALDDINVTPKALLIAANKLCDCKTILSHTVYKYIQFPPVTSLFFLNAAFFHQTESSMEQT